MAATIGIKVANGDFYSILEENTAVKKRLVLTTVHNNQKSVQIDLYKSALKSMADALYIGSLVADNLSGPRGEPSIELIVTSTAEGKISAELADLAHPGKEKQHLSLHLKSFDEDKNDYADFEMDGDTGGPLREGKNVFAEPERKSRLVLILAGVALILVLGAALWFCLLRGALRKGAEGPRETTAEAPVSERDGTAPVYWKAFYRSS
ncbi:MAG: Hsp70 family protein [Treponema sp.]|jgi:hypothetical protein|nr:Hsp70 family protein [Treponema sp.]